MSEILWHPAVGRNRYCGPAALAILVGCDTDEAARQLRDITGQRAIYGVRPRDLKAALARHGLRASPTFIADPAPTLRQWVAHLTASRYFHGRFLLRLTGHYVIYDARDGQIADNHTIYPLPVDRYTGLRRRVRTAWRIEPWEQ